jgi:hypothetical protein
LIPANGLSFGAAVKMGWLRAYSGTANLDVIVVFQFAKQ